MSDTNIKHKHYGINTSNDTSNERYPAYGLNVYIKEYGEKRILTSVFTIIDECIFIDLMYAAGACNPEARNTEVLDLIDQLDLTPAIAEYGPFIVISMERDSASNITVILEAMCETVRVSCDTDVAEH